MIENKHNKSPTVNNNQIDWNKYSKIGNHMSSKEKK